MWVLYALLAAFSAAVVTVLSKAGIRKVDSNLAFAIQAVMILVVTWIAVAVNGSLPEIASIDKKTWIYLLIAGVVTAVSSMLTFRALKDGDASQVNPLERVSLVFAIVLAAIFLKEKITWQVVTGGALMTAGALVIAFAKRA
ncbi:EamA family transporter [Sediminibacterium roseum]|uniref:EamA family transporter n=1 Tax=Sediminibacterium roseum TaxID=1978412 RepID=A0ABW9ZUR1_9BACT|nr:EamA family transporter [Sediminibacterium roseum]NCI50107.1 EamA family transporter [Sediminibacterium roseum]